MKTCSKCKEEKDNSNFHISAKEKDGLQKQCKHCQSKRKKEWYKENKEKALNDNYKYKYGISLEEYNELNKIQKGCCAICGKSEQENKRKLAVDHCHTTGKVRKLLCANCNAALGLVKENKETLIAMVSYLMEHNFD